MDLGVGGRIDMEEWEGEGKKWNEHERKEKKEYGKREKNE